MQQDQRQLQVLVFTAVDIENDAPVERLDFSPVRPANIIRTRKQDGLPAGVEFVRCCLNGKNKTCSIVDWTGFSLSCTNDRGLAKCNEVEKLAYRAAVLFCQWPIKIPEHETAFIESAFNNTYSGYADDLTEGSELLVNGRQDMRTPRLSVWKVSLVPQ